MKQPRHEIAAAIARRSLSTHSVSAAKDLGDEIAAYLLAERRTGDLESLLRDIIQYRADHGIVEVIAVSAFALSDKVRADITAEVRKLQPDAKEIIISHRLDSSVVSGVRLEFANQQLDMSARSKLNKLKQLTQAGSAGKER